MVKWNIEKMFDYCKLNNLDLPLVNQKYINTKHLYKYKCLNHGIYNQTWDNHKSGHGCPKCKNEKLSYEKTKYNNDLYLEKLITNNIKLYPIDKYKNYSISIKHECLKCGYTLKASPNNALVNKSGCPKCKGTLGISFMDVFHKCNLLNLDTPLEHFKYYKLSKVYHYICKKCKCVYSSSLNDHFRNDSRKVLCPNCYIFNLSKGEQYIKNYLNEHHIKYESQKKFEDLKDKQLLSYDFYLPDYKILIEYQGQQHYESFEYFGGKNKFSKQQYHDKLKREYAEDNGYKLLELKYTLNNQNKINNYLMKNIGL